MTEFPPKFVSIVMLNLSLLNCAGSSEIVDLKRPDSVANPAARKCTEDGYVLLPILENDIPVGYWCVDPLTQSRCEAWDYFRGSCSFTNQSQP